MVHFIEAVFLITGITFSTKILFLFFASVFIAEVTDYKIEVYCAADFL